MPSSRKPRPRARPTRYSPELVAALERMMAVVDFKTACRDQAWKTAAAVGSNCCGAAEFAAAEAAVIASGHVRPPEPWFKLDPILLPWIRGEI